MKKYILIASIAIIAVLNFTLVKSKTGEVTLKSITELAQANADESLPSSAPLGTTIDNIVGGTTTTESESYMDMCGASAQLPGGGAVIYCKADVQVTCSWTVTSIYHSVYRYDSYYIEGSNPACYVTEWRNTANYTTSTSGFKNCKRSKCTYCGN